MASVKRAVHGVVVLLFAAFVLWYALASSGRKAISVIAPTAGSDGTQLQSVTSDLERIIERHEVMGVSFSSSESETAACRLFGEIVDSDGNFLSVPYINVFKVSTAAVSKVPVHKGMFEHFVGEGEYALLVPEDSLPNGILPQLPLQKFQTQGFTDESGIYPPLVVVVQGDKEAKAQVVLLRPCRVEGRILNGEGEVVENAFVRLQSFIPGAQSLSIDSSTGQDGRFFFSNVRPGAKYVLTVWLDDVVLDKNRLLSLPIPISVQTEPGQIHLVPDIVVGKGEVSLQGQVVDQDGQPYANLMIVCYYGGVHRPTQRPFGMSATLAWKYTDENGRFLMEDLPASLLEVQLCGDWEPGIPLGKRNTAFWLPAIGIDATGQSGVLDIGTHIVDRSMPFRLTIQLIDQGVQELMSPCTVEMNFLDSHNGWSSKDAGRPSFSPMEWNISPESPSIEWSCETPLPPVLFRVLREEKEVGRLEVFPAPDTTRQVFIVLDE